LPRKDLGALRSRIGDKRPVDHAERCGPVGLTAAESHSALEVVACLHRLGAADSREARLTFRLIKIQNAVRPCPVETPRANEGRAAHRPGRPDGHEQKRAWPADPVVVRYAQFPPLACRDR
jgi:hypothetical protein